MQRKFITNLGLLLFLNLLIKPFWILGIDRGVQNAVGADGYGLYYALFNFSFLLNILLDGGLTNFNNQNIARHQHLLQKHLSSLLTLRLALGVLYAIATLGSAFVLGYRGHSLRLLAVLGFNQFLISLILFLRSNLSGLHLFKTDSVVSVLDRTIMIGICGLLLWGNVAPGGFELYWFVYAQTFAYGITAVVALVLVWDRARIKRLTWNWPFSLMMLKKSIPYATLVLLMTFYNRIDTVMLERISPRGPQEAAVYASAYRLLDATNMVAYLVAGLLLPMFSRMFGKGENPGGLARLAFRMLMVISIPTFMVCAAYSNQIMGLLYTEHVMESAAVFPWLMGCFVCVSTTYVFGTLLTANGSMKKLNTMAGLGIVVNILLNVVLIPKFQAQGTAWASLTTQGLTAAVQVVMANRLFSLGMGRAFWFGLFRFAGGLGMLALVLPQTSLPWLLGVVIFAVLSLVWALGSGWMKWRDWRTALQTH